MAGLTGPYGGGDGVVGRMRSFWAIGRGVRGLRRWDDEISAREVIISKIAQIEAKNISAIDADVKVLERPFASLKRRPDKFSRLINFWQFLLI